MAMLTLREYTYPQLKEKLNKEDRIIIVSCDSCARFSDNLGGAAGMDSLGDKLAADGFNVTYRSLVKKGCRNGFLGEQLADERVSALFKEADAVLPLMCIGGQRSIRELLPEEKLQVITRSIGKGPHDTPDGTRFTQPFESAQVIIDDPEKGISLPEAARQLGLEAGPY